MNEQVRDTKRASTQAAEGVPRWRWTTLELVRLIELGAIDPDERIELIGGEIVPMSPKGRQHEALKEDLAQFWTLRAAAEQRVRVEQQLNLDVETYTDPDIIVRPAELRSYDLKGPDLLLLVEIADTSWDKDVGVKAQLYSKFGVREYWVIDAVSRTTRVHKEPTPAGYLSAVDTLAREILTPHLAPNLAICLAGLPSD